MGIEGLKTISFWEDLNTFCIRMEGRIDAAKFIPIYERVLSHEAHRPGMDFVWDCTQVRIGGMELNEFRRLMEMVRDTAAKRGPCCSAWVFRDMDDYCLACLVNACFGKFVDVEYEIFRSVAEAREWLIQRRVLANRSAAI